MLRGQVPAAIQGTYSLLNAIICDNDESLSSHTKSCIYSMSIIRAVNLLLDQEQNSLYAKSMLLMAKRANLPESVIKCRHKSSHSEIPDIDTLRIVAKEAINYLYKKYWICQFDMIASKTNDKSSDTHWLFAIYTLCYLTISSKTGGLNRNINGECNYTPNKYVPWKIKSNVEDMRIETILTDCMKILSIYARRRYLSISRKLEPAKKMVHGYDKAFIELIYLISRKVLNGCIYEDFFISIFVEFIFANYRPSRSHLFFLVLFHTVSRLSFNFTIKLVMRMLGVICETSRSRAFQDANTSERVESYFRVLEDYKFKNSFNDERHINTRNVKRRVFEWLMVLAEYGKSITTGRSFPYHSIYTKICRFLSKKEYKKMIAYEFTGLTKILRSIQLLIPYASSKVNKIPGELATWEKDKISHIMNVVRPSGNTKYRSAPTMTIHTTREEIMLEIEGKTEEIDNEINKILAPGILWKGGEWKTTQTYPLYGPNEVDMHDRITSTVKLIREENLKSKGYNKNAWEMPLRTHRVDRNSESAKDERHRIASELNSIISHITNPDR